MTADRLYFHITDKSSPSHWTKTLSHYFTLMLKVNITQLYNILAREPLTPKQCQKQLWTHFEMYAAVLRSLTAVN